MCLKLTKGLLCINSFKTDSSSEDDNADLFGSLQIDIASKGL